MPARATLDFFGGQERARRRTGLLLCGFAAALAGVVAIVYLALVIPVGLWLHLHGWWNGPLLGGVAAGVAAVTAVGTAWHAVALGAHGGDAVARRLGGVPLARGSADLGERRFEDVLEEMAIAAGLPVPRGYVLPGESGVNAFAAGATPGRSVVVVTRGALDRLTRDELQGVVAHELSHVLHGDVRLNARLLALVGGLGALAALGRMLWRAADAPRRREVGQGRAVLAGAGAALAVAGWAGRLCGELLRFAVSREREHLADAAAVQFTRNPEGLAGALRKAADVGSMLQTPQAAAVSHFLFANGVAGVLETWFATHPPVEERIARLLQGGEAGGIRGSLPSPRPSPRRWRGEGDQPPTSEIASASSTSTSTSSRSPYPHPSPSPYPSSIADEVVRPESFDFGLAPVRPERSEAESKGEAYAQDRLRDATASRSRRAPFPSLAPGPEHIAFASAVLAALPASLAAAAREPFGARGIACALLLGPPGPGREAQLARLGRESGEVHAAEAGRLARLADGLAAEARVALLDLLLPALDALSPPQAAALRGDLAGLACEAGHAPVLRWALHRALTRRLDRRLSGRARAPVRFRDLGQIEPECHAALSLLAWAGASGPAAAQAAL
ncbi:MAG TPA: M48 family metalloprotease, partial [Anaeromyxobacteraceae bacterium]|nr:M48 family metalloprotease [Anaeromyxobacteraceae bacterium]